MPTLFDSLLKISSDLAETGLLVMDSALKTAQAGIGSLVGQHAHEPLKPPLQGPPDLDSAISDLANRTARIARFTPFEASYAPKFLTDFLDAAKRSFANIDWKDPKNLVIPLQVPFSIGTLMTQSALRGLASFEIVGPKAYPTFLANVFEMFTEIQIYVGVQYQELIDIQEKRLRVAPQDSAARVELGRVLIKCGRYIDAARELKLAAEDPAVRELALHECAVANYRAGYFRQAVADGSAAMAVNPGNERARAFLWLSAQRIGGYPPEVPAAHRMEMKVGYEKPVVEFEDIAIKVGLDKTSAGRGLA